MALHPHVERDVVYHHPDLGDEYDGLSSGFAVACRKIDATAAGRRLQHLSGVRNGAPTSTVEALMFELRRGVEALTEPDVLHRLSQLSQAQLLEVCERLQNFKPGIATTWTPEEVDALAELWSKVHENG
jgi:hypothetical protein